MASGSRWQRTVVLPRWIRPLHRYWKPLLWVWTVLPLGIGINVGSSWLLAKTLDLTGTPLGWLIDHPWLSLPPLLFLAILTVLAGLAIWWQGEAVLPAPSLTLTPNQRLQLLSGLAQEYESRFNSSLQGRVILDLQLQERPELLASARLVFRQLETGEVAPRPAGTSILQVYDQAARGLLILGASGSGKSTLLLSLARGLVQRAEYDSDYPLPILLSLSSWASTQAPLERWLGERCALAYGFPIRYVAAWIAQERVQFLLDGLDEMEEKARTACIEELNCFRQAHLAPLVVCSRTQEYTSQGARLILPGAVEIQPLDQAQITQVLKQAGPSLRTVRGAIRRNAIFRELLTTPLMVSVTVLAYANNPGQQPPQRGSREEQQQALFALYVEHMLHRYHARRRFSSQETYFWLSWLAQQMRQRHITEFHLETLQSNWLSSGLSRIIYHLIVGIIVWVGVWLVFGLYGGLLKGFVYGLVFGLIIGFFFGLIVGSIGLGKEIRSTEKFAWSWKRGRNGLVIGLVIGLFLGLCYWLSTGRVDSLKSVLVTGLVLGLIIGLVIGLFLGLESTPQINNVRLSPNQGIHTSGLNALRFSLIFFLFGGFLGGLIYGLDGKLIEGLLFALFTGLGIGLAGGLTFGGTACIRHYVLRWMLALSHVLPWRSVLFLEEVTRCVLLQRVGGGYRFIHPLLQEYFASLTNSLPSEP